MAGREWFRSKWVRELSPVSPNVWVAIQQSGHSYMSPDVVPSTSKFQRHAWSCSLVLSCRVPNLSIFFFVPFPFLILLFTFNYFSIHRAFPQIAMIELEFPFEFLHRAQMSEVFTFGFTFFIRQTYWWDFHYKIVFSAYALPIVLSTLMLLFQLLKFFPFPGPTKGTWTLGWRFVTLICWPLLYFTFPLWIRTWLSFSV